MSRLVPALCFALGALLGARVHDALWLRIAVAPAPPVEPHTPWARFVARLEQAKTVYAVSNTLSLYADLLQRTLTVEVWLGHPTYRYERRNLLFTTLRPDLWPITRHAPLGDATEAPSGDWGWLDPLQVALEPVEHLDERTVVLRTGMRLALDDKGTPLQAWTGYDERPELRPISWYWDVPLHPRTRIPESSPILDFNPEDRITEEEELLQQLSGFGYVGERHPNPEWELKQEYAWFERQTRVELPAFSDRTARCRSGEEVTQEVSLTAEPPDPDETARLAAAEAFGCVITARILPHQDDDLHMTGRWQAWHGEVPLFDEAVDIKPDIDLSAPVHRWTGPGAPGLTFTGQATYDCWIERVGGTLVLTWDGCYPELGVRP